MSKIELIHGSCVEQEVDAIVNAANKYLLSGGGICGAIFNKAGYDKLNEACKMIKTPLNDGDAVITDSFDISNCKYIIHAVGPDFNIDKNGFEKLYKAYYNSLLVLKENDLHSISFPLISAGIFSGNLDNPVMVTVKECLNAYNSFIKEFDYEINVKLCCFSISEYKEACKYFND